MNTTSPANQVKSLPQQGKPMAKNSPGVWHATLEDIDMGSLFGRHNLVVKYYYTAGYSQPVPIGEGMVDEWISPEIEIIWVRLDSKDGVKVTGYIEDEDRLLNMIIDENHT